MATTKHWCAFLEITFLIHSKLWKLHKVLHAHCNIGNRTLALEMFQARLLLVVAVVNFKQKKSAHQTFSNFKMIC